MTAVVALVGPTGSGKSALALRAAERLADGGRPVEIVAVDAFTVYRGMDIGTAKASAEERRLVPHRMVDVLEPEQECSVEWFQREARAAIEGVRERGALPLLVGGSGLYFRAVVDPMRFPPTDAAVRARVAERHPDAPSAHEALHELDPRAAGQMDPGNYRRAVRALEVIELTGRPFSSYGTDWQRFDSVYSELVVLGVEVERPELRGRIAARTRQMLAAGWLDEARGLLGRALSVTARQAMGYEELFAHLRGELSLDEAEERIVSRTRRYAAYQARWFRRDPRVRWRAPSQVVEELLRCAS